MDMDDLEEELRVEETSQTRPDESNLILFERGCRKPLYKFNHALTNMKDYCDEKLLDT